MKTIHLLMIIAATMVSLVAFGTYVVIHPIFGGIAPSSTIKGYIQIDTLGLEKTYKVGQPINFSVLIQGFGLYPCQPPQITIYNNAQTKPVFNYTLQNISCHDSSEHYIFYFPSQNSTFSTMINKTGNYTAKVSIGQDSYQKQFSVTAYDITGIYDTRITPLSVNATNTNFTSQTQNPFMADENGKVNLSKIHLSYNQYGQIDYEKIGHMVSESQFEKILDEMNISYAQNNLIVQDGMSILTLPPITDYCGYVKDNNAQEHWFSSSYHNDTLQNYKVYTTNPEPCSPGTPFACFCVLQTHIAENNVKELSYFTTSEESTVGNTLSKYFDGGNVVNVSNEFVVGKYNMEIDPSTIHYCGKFTWGASLTYFEGYIKNSTVVDLTLASEKQKLCAISNDAKLFSFNEIENGIRK